MNAADLIRAIVPARLRPYQWLSQLAWTASRGCVQRGPFQGMRYVGRAANSALVPKLLGTYERELFDAIEELVGQPPELLVDVGCAEGYYAVGFARRCRSMRVVAFDKDPSARTLVAQLGHLNDVAGRIVVEGACSPAALSKVLTADSCVVICDVEGYESVLLNPDVVPGLINATILVEVHDSLAASTGATLETRFFASHAITRIAAVPRQAADCPRFHPLLRFAPKETILSLIVERPDEHNAYWLLMKPRVATTGPR